MCSEHSGDWFYVYLIAGRTSYSSIALYVKEKWSFNWKMREGSNNQRQNDIEMFIHKRCAILFYIYGTTLHPHHFPGNFYGDETSDILWIVSLSFDNYNETIEHVQSHCGPPMVKIFFRKLCFLGFVSMLITNSTFFFVSRPPWCPKAHFHFSY